MIRSLFLQFLWDLLNDISFLMILSLVSLSVPGISQLIQGIMISFIYLDVLMTDKWLMHIIYREDKEDEDEALSQQFADNGFASMSLIRNLQSTFVYLIVLLFLFVVLFIAKLLRHKFLM